MSTDPFYFAPVAVRDLEGTWHLRDNGDTYIDPRAVADFAWFACGTKDDDDPINGIEATSTVPELSMSDDRCAACFPAGVMAGAHL